MKTGSIARTALLLVSTAGCGSGARAIPSPPPPRVHGEPVWRELLVCVMEEGVPRQVPVQYNRITGDTVVGGRPFTEAYPVTAQFAGEAEWYLLNEPIRVADHGFIKYGRTRILDAGQVVPLERTYRGVPLYGERAGDAFPSGPLYVPVSPACEFQSYQWDLVLGGVRG